MAWNGARWVLLHALFVIVSLSCSVHGDSVCDVTGNVCVSVFRETCTTLVLEIDVVGQQYEQTVSADSFVDESSEVELECVPMGDDSDCETCLVVHGVDVNAPFWRPCVSDRMKCLGLTLSTSELGCVNVGGCAGSASVPSGQASMAGGSGWLVPSISTGDGGGSAWIPTLPSTPIGGSAAVPSFGSSFEMGGSAALPSALSAQTEVQGGSATLPAVSSTPQGGSAAVPTWAATPPSVSAFIPSAIHDMQQGGSATLPFPPMTYNGGSASLPDEPSVIPGGSTDVPSAVPLTSSMRGSASIVMPPPTNMGGSASIVMPPPTNMGGSASIVMPPPTNMGGSASIVMPPPTSMGGSATAGTIDDSDAGGSASISMSVSSFTVGSASLPTEPEPMGTDGSMDENTSSNDALEPSPPPPEPLMTSSRTSPSVPASDAHAPMHMATQPSTPQEETIVQYISPVPHTISTPPGRSTIEAEDTNVLIYVMMAIIGVMTLLCIVCLLAAYLLYKRRSKNMLDFLEDGDDEELFPL